MSRAPSTAVTATVGSRTRRAQWSILATAAIATAAIFSTPRFVAGWASMLLNCAAVVMLLKQWIWLTSDRVTRLAKPGDRAKFYLLWPGCDLPAFLDRTAVQPTAADWTGAAVRIASAAFLLWGVNRWLPYDEWPLECGIFGMGSGILFVLFGLFHLLALVWRALGRNVTPIMNAPWAAVSLADFWGRRWNLAFRDSAAQVVFRPLARGWGTNVATIGTFLFSGILHEAIISLPARGGYGLPTLYFLLQSIALMIQRQFLRLEPNSWNLASRVTTFLIVFAPMPLLFTRPFCEHAVIPFLHALGALS